MYKKYLKDLFYIFLPLLVGLFSSLISGNNLYDGIVKPPLSPPGFIFGIVWTILYLLMGISYYLLKKNSYGYDVSRASFLYYAQLVVNFFWPIFFFKNEAFTFSFIWLLLLLGLVILTALNFKKINKISFYLLIPYIIWIIFAGYLNLGIAILN